jgi:CheY-like chemotaxis protein
MQLRQEPSVEQGIHTHWVGHMTIKTMTQTILLVEDDKKISMALSLRLKSMGYQVDSAADAVYAMNAAMRCQPEVVLLDINLPGGNGFVVADRLRASLALGATPIIFITASKNAGLRERAAQYSASAYLEKPFQAADLVEALDRFTRH